MSETKSLKCLSTLVLERNMKWNKPETDAQNFVSSNFSRETKNQCFLTADFDSPTDLEDVYHERRAKVDRVTQKVNEIEASHQSHPVTPRNDNIRYFYLERAGIMEFEGGLDRKEAEEKAFYQALAFFVREVHPNILAEFEHLIYQQFLN